MSILLKTTGDTVLNLKNKFVSDDIIIKVPQPKFEKLVTSFNSKNGEITASVGYPMSSYFPNIITANNTVQPRNYIQDIISNSFICEDKIIKIPKIPNIDPSIIKKGVQIYGVTGSYDAIKEIENTTNLNAIINKTITSFNNSNVTRVAPGRFNNCSVLSSVSLPMVTNIADFAFLSCSSLKNVTLSDSPITLGISAFANCLLLENLNCGEILSLDEKAFFNCSSLKNINYKIPDIIPSNVFNCCNSLETITNNNDYYYFSHVTTIGSSAFYSCSSLRHTINLENATSIGESAFYGCTNINFPTVNGLTQCFYNEKKDLYIGGGAFGRCNKLENIVLPEYNGKFNITSANSLRYFSLPKVTYLDFMMFAMCPQLESASFNDIDTVVGGYNFESCTNLKYVAFKGKIPRIGGDAFYGCTNLEELFITGATTVPTLGYSTTFTNTPLTNSNNSTARVYTMTSMISKFASATNWVRLGASRFTDAYILLDGTPLATGVSSSSNVVTWLDFVSNKDNKYTRYYKYGLEKLSSITSGGTSFIGFEESGGFKALKDNYRDKIVNPSDYISATSDYSIVEFVPGDNLINFTINGASYQSESGWVWAEWLASSYTDGNFDMDGSAYIINTNNGLTVSLNGTKMRAADIITPNASYTLI